MVTPLLLLLAAAAPASPPAPAPTLSPAAPVAPPAEQKLARELLAELVGLDTSGETGSTTPAAEAIARRLRKAGLPAADVQVLGPSPKKKNLVARLRGTGKRPPLLLLGHLDVVPALRQDWSLEPYRLTEKDGYFWGRGTQDMKGQVALWVATVLRLRREAAARDRDIILALTADEERGGIAANENGAHWLLEQHRPLMAAELALNEGGGGEIKGGRRRANDVMASEKGYISFRLEVRNKGGHSALPAKDNAIVRLAEGLARLGKHDEPARLDPVVRAYLGRLATIEPGPLAADMRALAASAPGAALDPGAVARLSAWPNYNARLRTTCVPTRLEGGHADNALPQLAAAVVNCRLLPGDTEAGVRAALAKTLADDQIQMKAMAPLESGPVGLPPPEVMATVERVTARHFPGVPVLPVMSTGASDGRFLRAAGIPTFGVSGIFSDIDDVRSHGRDERILVQSFYEAQEFLYDLVKELVAPAGALP
jgi:acetylornithine deacetylase/succinyl-diaminopimelate desuccinylase-like protein